MNVSSYVCVMCMCLWDPTVHALPASLYARKKNVSAPKAAECVAIHLGNSWKAAYRWKYTVSGSSTVSKESVHRWGVIGSQSHLKCCQKYGVKWRQPVSVRNRIRINESHFAFQFVSVCLLNIPSHTQYENILLVRNLQHDFFPALPNKTVISKGWTATFGKWSKPLKNSKYSHVW